MFLQVYKSVTISWLHEQLIHTSFPKWCCYACKVKLCHLFPHCLQDVQPMLALSRNPKFTQPKFRKYPFKILPNLPALRGCMVQTTTYCTWSPCLTLGFPMTSCDALNCYESLCPSPFSCCSALMRISFVEWLMPWSTPTPPP